MIEQAFRIGTFANIPLRIHWTFVFIIIYIVGMGLNDGNSSSQIIVQICFTLSMFMCVVLHEFGHALTAKRYGINTEDIILLPIGGVARLQHFPDKPKQEFIIAIMGPVVNLIIAIFIFIGLYLFYGNDVSGLFETENLLSMDWQGFFPLLLLSNILLMVFNMIPAFPMDGGRVLRALISMKSNRLTATKWSTRIGQVICILFIVFGFYFQAWTTVFIGVFIFLSAQQEYRHVVKEFTLKNKKVGSYIRHLGLCLTDYQKISLVKDQCVFSGNNNFPVIDLTGQYIGSVSIQEILKNTKENSDLIIRDIMHPQVYSMDKNEDLMVAVQHLDSHCPAIFVYDQQQLIGIIDHESINHGLALGI